jgi:hypothetical protein
MLSFLNGLIAFFFVLRPLARSNTLYQINGWEVNVKAIFLQGAAERTPRFRRGVARGGVGVEQWGVCR